jgi:cytochrome c peroxidase
MSTEKVVLGEALFFDPNLSSCGTIACASCHMPEMGFGDGERISDGCDGATGRRNSNTIYNVAYLSHLFWDGRVQSLEQQALGPVVDPAEMANSWDNVLHYLSTGEHPISEQHFPASARFYKKYFGHVFAGEMTTTNVAKALAAYQRTVVSRDSPFDRWLGGDDSAMSLAQKEGALVFFGRGQCSECHPPPNFTDSDFHNVGAPNAGFEKPEMFSDNSRICGGIREDVDPGRAEVSFLQSSCTDVGKFKTPTLRNVEVSGPYMHNGRFFNLDAVLQHYWNVGRGTADATVGSLDEEVQLVMLTDSGGHPSDIINLTEFLKALTGTQTEGPPHGVAPPEELDE